MKQKIRHRLTGAILHEGNFSTLAACAEDAIQSHVALDGADLSRANLINTCLDSGSFRNACFRGANLMGANLSEAILDHADFTDAELQNACVCASSLSCVIFHGASFGATNITDSVLVNCAFDTLSAFTLNFADVRELRNCSFKNASNNLSFFTLPPVHVSGLECPVVLLDDCIRVGQITFPLTSFDLGAADKNFYAAPPSDVNHINRFIHAHADLLRSLMSLRPAGMCAASKNTQAREDA